MLCTGRNERSELVYKRETVMEATKFIAYRRVSTQKQGASGLGVPLQGQIALTQGAMCARMLRIVSGDMLELCGGGSMPPWNAPSSSEESSSVTEPPLRSKSPRCHPPRPIARPTSTRK